MRILIIEDDSNVRSFLQNAMKALRRGVKIETAANGADGLKMARRQWYDLIITDYHMPKMSGFDVTLALRQDGYTMPIVVVSADPDTEADALMAGASLFLHKPVSLENLRYMLDMMGL
ncbi:response regulator [Chloroflexus sp.]|uniref:response regulator n=1 Tax=Chloroflexus sp. TaxID=1904827 RepID=UPI0029FD7901|nr:response regulator [Chloroflexus sp.]MCS6888371.1 response regulator [Chloroflexus sp.]